MKLTIKVLQGRETEVEVSDDATVLDVKREVLKTLGHPMEHQKLLHLGKSLLDEKLLSFYRISSGKLTLVLKKPEPFPDTLLKQLKRHHNEAEAQRILKEFMNELETTVKNMSLDDLERLSTNLLT